MPESISVAAVIVAYNSGRFVFDCIDTIRAQTCTASRIVVVDNASTDGSRERLRETGGIVLIENGENVGFAAANNQGIAAAGDGHVLCCNSDVLLEPDFLEKALPHFGRDPRIGMLTGKILRFDRSTIDSTGQFLSASRWPRERGYGERDRGQYDREEEVFSVCGACALYRREMISEIAPNGELFDPRYFAFYEDLDVGWRARRSGWRAYYVPIARAYHYRGGSSGSGRFAFIRKSPEIRFHILKNRYLTISKNDTLLGFLLHLPAIVARDAVLLGHTAVSAPGVLVRLVRYVLALPRRSGP